jgi:hypothetical protein
MGNRAFKEVDLLCKNITLEEYMRNTEDSEGLEINAYTYDRWIQSTGTLPYIIKNGKIKWKALFGDVYLSELKKLSNLRIKNSFRITGSLINYDEKIELKREIKMFFKHYKQSIKEWYPWSA